MHQKNTQIIELIKQGEFRRDPLCGK